MIPSITLELAQLLPTLPMATEEERIASALKVIALVEDQMFIDIDSGIIPISSVSRIDLSNLVDGEVAVIDRSGQEHSATQFNMISKVVSSGFVILGGIII